MIYLIFILVISIIVGVIESNRNYYKQFYWEVFWDGSGTGFTITAIISFALFVSASFFVNYPNRHSVKNHIECLADNNTTSGSFFLGCGTVDGKMKFAYYEHTNTGFELKSIDADQVSIVYTTEKPYIEYVYKDLKKDSFWTYLISDSQLLTIIFHVPKGSINNKYDLNAE